MKLKLCTAFMTLASFSPAFAGEATGTFNVDPTHSKVGFEIPHLVISSVEGKFTGFEGKVEIEKDFKKSKIEGKIQSASIDTGVKQRDDHLKSPDFFDVAKYPDITFKATSIDGTRESFKLTGDLTIHGVTKKVTLDSKLAGPVADGFGNEKIAVQAKTKFNRKDFGLVWGKAVEAGPVVGDEVTIDLKIEAARPLAKK